jgi:hypothetical protein
MIRGLGGNFLLFDSSGTPSGKLSMSGTCLFFRDPLLILIPLLNFPSLLESLSSLDIPDVIIGLKVGL